MSDRYSGYHPCPCRDCMEIAIGTEERECRGHLAIDDPLGDGNGPIGEEVFCDGSCRGKPLPAFCHECGEAGCERGEHECSVEHSSADEWEDLDRSDPDREDFHSDG